jgi:hypothetical protein
MHIRFQRFVLLMAALALPHAAQAGQAVADVNATLLDSIRASADTTPPPLAARAISMVGIAMFDAVNAGSHLGYQSYFYDGPAVSGASRDALAIAAGYTMMANLFPALSSPLTGQMNARLDALAVSATARATSQALGSSIATNFYNARLGDGSALAQTPYLPGSNPGDFQPIGGDPLLPGWGSVTPFALSSATQFGTGAPPALGSAEWIADYQQVRALGCATCGTAEQQLIARFWADGGSTMTPPGHWLSISNDLIDDMPTLTAARTTALLGMAVGRIASWTLDRTISRWPLTYLWIELIGGAMLMYVAF